MQHTASKLDWLKGRKDFNTNPVARAATRLLEHQYAPHGDALYPWILREIRKGNIQLPQPYRTKGGWMELVKSEMAAEQELARREAWIEEHPDEPTPDSWSWDEDHKQIDWNDLDNADWNQLTDYLRWLQEAQSGEGSGWEMLHKAGGGQRFDINHPGGVGYRDYRQPLTPNDLRRWDKVLADRAKRRKAVDPMQFSAADFAANMNDQWYPEYEDKLRGDSGEVVHQFPDKWTIRRLRDERECEQEGEDMGHCVGGYGDWVEKGNTHIFSLRDPKNRPHTTLEIKPRSGQPDPEYDIWDKYGVLPHRGWVETVNMLANGGLDDPDTQARLQQLTPDSDMWKLCQIAQETRERQQQQAPLQPWHRGQLQQVYGKEDEPPKAEYQQRIRDWFGAMPETQHPANLEDTPYHPDAMPSHWMHNDRNWGAAFPEGAPVPAQIGEPQPAGAPPLEHVPGEHLGNVHYPGLTHKSRVHGRPCHCPWGSKERPWSWSSRESAIEWEDDLDPRSAGQRGRRERLPARGSRGVGSAWDLPAPAGGTGDAGERREDPGDLRPLERSLSGRAEHAGRGGASSGRRDRPHAGDRHAASEYPFTSFDQLVAAYQGFLTVGYTETPEAVDIYDIQAFKKGEGVGTRFMRQAKAYCDQLGKQLVVSEVTNPGFFNRFDFLNPEQARSGRRPRYLSKTGVCPTCGDPLAGQYGTFCPRCSWTENDANLDSDPLSNPPDPTVDMHRGIQARTVVADKLHDFLMNPKSRPDLQTPEGQGWLRALANLHERLGDKFDPLTPWLTREWKKGRIENRGGHLYYKDYPDGPDSIPTQYALDPGRLGHWADFLQANHPVRREMSDIMKEDIGSFTDRVQAWNQAMKEQAHQRALDGGEVVHTTPDGYTVRQLTKPEELKAEGDAMGHCVGGYGDEVAKGRSLIYSLRDPKGQPHVTTEISPKQYEWTDSFGRPHRSDSQSFDDDGPISHPIPHGGHVVQIQGRANQEPKDEYKARLRDWFTSFPIEDRPRWPDENEESLYDEQGYSHEQLDHPDLIPDYEEQHGALTSKTEPTEDDYGVLHVTTPMAADYEQLLDNIGFRDYGYYQQPDRSHINDIYRLARERGEIPQLAQALEGYSDKQDSSLQDWMDQNWEMSPHYPDPDSPDGWEDEDGDTAEEGQGRPYWTPRGVGDGYGGDGDRVYDPTEAESEYDEAYGQWSSEHPGVSAVSRMYELLNPHYYDGGYQQEPQQPPQEPPQAPQAFSSTVPSHRWGKWLQAVEDAP